jgi:hypothetical protein
MTMLRPFLLLALALVLAPRSSHAQTDPPATPSAANLARAKELRLKAHQLFDDHSYAEALIIYKESYQLSGDPALLYNIGRAHQFLNEAPEALGALEAFVAKASPELKAKVQGLEETLAEARRKVTTLTVTSNVVGARVLVRKKEIGRTPLKAVRVLAGEADREVEIEVISETHETLSRKVSLRGGESLILELNLTSLKNTSNGLLIVRSSVPGARVQVDGRSLGVVPAEVQLPPGEHRVSLSADGHKESSLSLVIKASERRELDVDLQKAPKPTRWWLWAGLGAVIVGGAVLTIALTTERSADQGTLGQRSVPLLRF